MASADGSSWETIIDWSGNQQDHPHAYIELPNPVQARFVKYDHDYITNQYLSISEFRVFGQGLQSPPLKPANFVAERQEDRRDALLSWDPDPEAMGYVIYWGIAEDKLNLSAMMYGQNEYMLRALNTEVTYFLRVEAFNEHGISESSEILKID